MPSAAETESSIARRHLMAAVLGIWIGFATLPASGQNYYNPPPGTAQFQPGYPSGTPSDAPMTNLSPIAPPPTSYTPPTNTFGSFDPYSTGSSSVGGPIPGVNSSLGPGVTTLGPPMGGYAPAPSGSSNPFGLFSSPTVPPTTPIGYGNQPGSPMNNSPIYGASPYGAPPTSTFGAPNASFPSSIYPQNTPNTLFPEGFGPIYSGPLFQGVPDTISGFSAFRLFQGPRFRYSYVSPGSKPEHLGINDFDASLAFAFPNFLYCNQPIYVIPSFSLHLWNGPDGSSGADLPAQAYSAFLDLGWQTDPNKMVATELGLRLGVFTDFDTYTSDSFRVMGKALVSFRFTPTTTFKTGLYYADRNEIKLIPAVGFFCRPTPQKRIDLFFPQPKYAQYCSTIGVYDLWWYVTGDLGGGNWTVERDEGYTDSVDINDLQVLTGFEWGQSQAMLAGRRTAFAEVGYVFERQVRYRYSPFDDFDPSEAISFRIGIGY